MKEVYDFIKGFDIHTIIIIGIAFWYLNSNMNGQLSALQNQVNDIDKRLSRIEGAFSVKNFCAITSNESRQKIEGE